MKRSAGSLQMRPRVSLAGEEDDCRPFDCLGASPVHDTRRTTPQSRSDPHTGDRHRVRPSPQGTPKDNKAVISRARACSVGQNMT